MSLEYYRFLIATLGKIDEFECIVCGITDEQNELISSLIWTGETNPDPKSRAYQ